MKTYNNDLISRAAMLEALGHFNGYVNDFLIGIETAKEITMNLPAVDAAPVVYGYWIEEPDRMRHWHCSECGKVQGITCIGMKYCPECGARMAEHPEPVYPTWGEWLEDMMCDLSAPIETPQSVNVWMYQTPIPADIAVKLGIKPKEG